MALTLTAAHRMSQAVIATAQALHVKMRVSVGVVYPNSADNSIAPKTR